ncbi:uncharacterized protein [Parasteatoda tepidariorum]|uniref:uncharacterized protein n=1 Tax=Parasteatoda tepidariorum TaxID=114398 RepID=UPI00077FB391|nr:uncharacterized protein LOC107455615 [Parasteatoda tepidariorum]XP_015928726.1 uncharacterized protein LOC107455615 [Parasteatoda tepidariorum]
MMENLNYSVRNMKEDDIPAIIDLYKNEKWLDGYYNLYVWSQFDPEGFKVAESYQGDIIGTCFGIRQDEKLATIGGYVVKKELRGKGIGKKLWAACLQHIENRKATINGEGEAWKMYYKTGDFPIIENEWRFLMHHTDDEINSKNLSSNLPADVTIQPFSETDLEAICCYDSSLLGFDRKFVLHKLFLMHETRTFVAFKRQKCVGYGCIQPNIYGGSFIAPLYADDPAVAETLLKTLIDSFPSKKSFEISTSSGNKICRDLLKKLNCMFETDECVRLYRNERFSTNLNSVYGLFIDYSPF